MHVSGGLTQCDDEMLFIFIRSIQRLQTKRFVATDHMLVRTSCTDLSDLH